MCRVSLLACQSYGNELSVRWLLVYCTTGDIRRCSNTTTTSIDADVTVGGLAGTLLYVVVSDGRGLISKGDSSGSGGGSDEGNGLVAARWVGEAR